MKLLSDNIALITGVANENSLAWPIAKTAHLHGARVVLSYRGEAEGRRAKKLAVKIGATTLPCDFTVKEEVEDLFAKIEKTGKLRYAVHSIAFSDRDELQGAFLDGSEQNFSNTMLVSCYSFIHMARHCARLMKQNTEIGENGDCGSIVGLTYAASNNPQPHYNYMSVAKAGLESAMRNTAYELGAYKIRVNLVSPSPEETLSARVIRDFRFIGGWAEGMSMLGRRATPEEIANLVVFLLSDRASCVTAQTIMADCGASVSGMPPLVGMRKIAETTAAVADKIEGISRLQKSPDIYFENAGIPGNDEFGDDPADVFRGSTVLSP